MEKTLAMGERYRVVLVAPEVSPAGWWPEAGPAARTAGRLPLALASLGNRVAVVAPRYRGMPYRRTVTDFAVPVGGRRATVVVRRSTLQGRGGRRGLVRVPLYLVDNYHYFDRDERYGYPDDGERFAFFCRAALGLLRWLGPPPDVLHLLDWPVAPLALLQREPGPDGAVPGGWAAPLDGFDRSSAGGGEGSAARSPIPPRGLAGGGGGSRPSRAPGASTSAGPGVPTVFTFYDAARQGNFARDVLALLGLPDAYFHPEELEWYGQVSFVKAGLLYAHVLVTVSRTYARALQTPAEGHGLDGVFRKVAHRLTGLVHGIDADEYDPRRDPCLYRPFDGDNLAARAHNKAALLQELALASSPLAPASVPGGTALAAYVGPLTRQAGAWMVLEGLDGLMERPLQVVVAGAGEPALEQALVEAASRYPGRMRAVVGFNSVLVRRIYAGADLVLVPAPEAPDAHGHLIALRYGAVPVVRAEGVLADTVVDFDAVSGDGNGFSFRGAKPEDLLHAVDQALDAYRKPELWRRLVRTAMECNYSWRRTAVEYMGLYSQATARVQALAVVRV